MKSDLPPLLSGVDNSDFEKTRREQYVYFQKFYEEQYPVTLPYLGVAKNEK